jgi:hypothetical protein
MSEKGAFKEAPAQGTMRRSPVDRTSGDYARINNAPMEPGVPESLPDPISLHCEQHH